MADKKLTVVLAVVPISYGSWRECFYNQHMISPQGTYTFAKSSMQEGESKDEAITRICKEYFGFKNKNAYYATPIIEDDKIVIPVYILADENVCKAMLMNSLSSVINRRKYDYEKLSDLDKSIDNRLYAALSPLEGPEFGWYIYNANK